jgi:hypothetical protein
MSRRPCAFRQRDIVRAVRGAEAAGVKIARVDIEPNTGTISIVPASISTNDSELDRWLKEQPQNATSA